MKPTSFSSIIFIIFWLSIIGCGQSNHYIEERLKEFIGTEIIIPGDLLLLNNTANPIRKDAKYKIISYVDSASCTSCYLDRFSQAWTDMIDNFKDMDFSLFIIFHSEDIEGIRTLFNSYKLNIPFFIDCYGDFKNSNNIPLEGLFHTFLLRDNTVTLVGTPFSNSKLLELYKQEMSKD